MFKKKGKEEAPEEALGQEPGQAPVPKKKGILLPILAGVVLLGLLGGGGFLVATGRVKLPTAGGPAQPSAKPKAVANKEATSQSPPAAKTPARPRTQARRQATPPPVRPPQAKAKQDVALGAKKIAKVWERIEAARLAEMVKDYKEPELAQIVVRMDPRKAADLLSVLEPPRAAKVSREMQRLASIVPPTEVASS
jgi:hypothetical protein